MIKMIARKWGKKGKVKENNTANLPKIKAKEKVKSRNKSKSVRCGQAPQFDYCKIASGEHKLLGVQVGHKAQRAEDTESVAISP